MTYNYTTSAFTMHAMKWYGTAKKIKHLYTTCVKLLHHIDIF